ncbi:hypothetical protein POM88_052797 [Heracleum sosnowskyi]|uniref:F-box domain-containing protein n=1 Tax=Heracleum sosnowskyi TaxID=360622 RepID=A0AAD8GR48_9APIA|nr:hypothetical protein POM88_052797 [Heracleum sosnowskyi]
MKATTITDLHEHILFSIFCFLPAKFVIRCRCVCKEWSSLICQPNFPYEYFSRGKAPLQFLLEKDKNIVLAQIDEALLTSDFSIPANSIFDLGIRRILSFPSSFPINTSVDLHIVTCQVTGWILVVIYPRPDPLFDEGKQYDCHMYNPITGQHIVVQKPTGDHAGWGNISCALVLAQKTNQLKFLELCDGKANIQTIGTNAWRSLGEVHRCDGLPIVLNGRCHWLNNKARDIISFDAEEEVFQVIHTLSCFRDYKWCNLGLLDGCLCVSLISSNYVSEIWVMNEYGIRDSWTKKFGLLEPLACLKDSSSYGCPDPGLVKITSIQHPFQKMDLRMERKQLALL